MKLLDATGREFITGQMVELFMNGTVRAILLDIHETSLTLVGQAPTPPNVIIQIMLQLPANPNSGKVDNVYIVAQPPSDPGPKLVQ